MGTRKVPFSRELYIEQDDFREDPPKELLPPLRPARRCGCARPIWSPAPSVVKDPQTGEVVEVHCTYDPATRGGNTPDGRKVKGTIHWVSAAHAVPAEVRLYDHLFTKPDPSDVPEGQRLQGEPESRSRWKSLPAAASSRAWRRPTPGDRFQFERLGYFSRRSRFDARQAGLQPHGVAARHLGEDREGAEVNGRPLISSSGTSA